MSTSTALEALPPSVGDAPVAAVLLRDVVADLLAADRPGGVDPTAIEVDDDGRFHLRATGARGPATDLEHAPFTAPELFHGATPDGRTDVYAAACLALTRYLGTPPVPAPPLGHRPTAAVRLGALRQAQRTVPARLGSLPDPFRAVFARAVAKERHLRPTPATLVAELDAAIAAVGGEAAARTRVHRLIVLARVFEPGAGSNLRRAPVAGAAVVASAPLHLPIRSLPALRPSRRATRVALIAAVTVVATGGVAVAAVVGLSSNSPQPRPQAIESLSSPAPSTSTSSRPSTAASSSAAPAPATTAPAAVVPVGGNGGSTSGQGSGNGSSNGGSGSGSSSRGSSGSGSSNSGSGGSGSGSGSGGGAATPAPPPAPPATSAPPPASSEPPPSQEPSTEPPPFTPNPPSTTPPPASTSAESTPTFTPTP